MAAAANFNPEYAVAAADINLFAPGSALYIDANAYVGPPGSFTVAGHAMSLRMTDQRYTPDGPSLYAQELADLIVQGGWSPGQPVYLLGCHTGGDTGMPGINNISQDVANILRTEVYGVDKYMFLDNGKLQIMGAVVDPSGPYGYRANMSDPGSLKKFSPYGE
jgi:hypothetical protein